MARKIKIIFTVAVFVIMFLNVVIAIQCDDENTDVARVREVSELRTENSDTWLLSDGSYECVVYSYDKYVSKYDGEMVLRSGEATAGASGTMDTYISSKYPDATYYANQYLRTGYGNDYGIRRSYLKFVLPTSVIAGKNIYQAYIKLKYVDSAATPNVDAYYVSNSWNSSTTTWNNKPSSYSNPKSSASIFTSAESTYTIYISEIMKSWAYGDSGRSNFGVLLKSSNEGTGSWATFYSSDSIIANKPELHIFYANKGACYLGIASNSPNHDHYSAYSGGVYGSFMSMGMNNSDLELHCGSYTKDQVSNFITDDKCSIFVSRSHGGYEDDYSGVLECTKLAINEVTGIEVFRSTVPLSSLDVSNLRLVAFVGCQTGYGGNGAANLPSIAVQRGATCAIGFIDEIGCNDANAWTIKFMNYLADGYSVYGAYNQLLYYDNYLNTNFEDVCISGNPNIFFV